MILMAGGWERFIDRPKSNINAVISTQLICKVINTNHLWTTGNTDNPDAECCFRLLIHMEDMLAHYIAYNGDRWADMTSVKSSLRLTMNDKSIIDTAIRAFLDGEDLP